MEELEGLNEKEHIIDLWEPLKFNIDENYKFANKGLIFSIFSNLVYYIISYPVLKVLTKVLYDLKIEGKEKLRNIKE